MRYSQSKRASVLDAVFIVVIVFVFAIVSVIGYKIFDSANTNLQGSQISTAGKSIIQNAHDKYVTIFDYGFLAVLFILFIGMIASALFTEVNPVWYILSFFVLIFTIMITGLLGNAFYSFGTNADITSSLSAFTFIPFVMQNYLKICGSLSVIGFIVGFIKVNNG